MHLVSKFFDDWHAIQRQDGQDDIKKINVIILKPPYKSGDVSVCGLRFFF